MLKLLNPKKGKECKIRLFIFDRRFASGGRFVYGTEYYIKPEQWNEKDMKPRLPKQTNKELEDLDTELDKLKLQAKELVKNYDSGSTIDNKGFKVDLEQALGKIPTQPTETDSKDPGPLSFFAYCEKQLDPTRVVFLNTRKISKRLEPGTLKSKRGSLTMIKNFQREARYKVEFDTINQDFYQRFRTWCSDRGLNPNTVGRIVKDLKTILNAATREGYSIPMDYKSFPVERQNPDTIYLSDPELEKISNKVIKGPMRKYKEFLLLSCYTGLRFSDLSRLSQEHIKDIDGQKYIKIKQQKTQDELMVPLHPVAEGIMRKYDYRLPKVPSNQKLNKNLKRIGQICGIDEVISTNIDGTKVLKYELITSHIGRRSIATNLYLQGMNPLDICSVTGHKDIRNLLTYIRADNFQKARKIAQHPYFKAG